MYRADPELFAGTTYATTCGFVDGRQPVVISADKQKELDKQYPGSYGDEIVAYGSTAETKSRNRYICPDIWCPVSEVSMTLAQLEEAGGKCPLPDEEKPEHYNKTDYFDGESRHIGFLDPSKHPNGLCLPCCFRKPGKRIDRCISSSDEGGNSTRTKYVMHFDVVPLPAPGRMGVLPLDLTQDKDVVRLASSRAPTDTSFSQCLKDILNIESIGKIVENMDRFLALGDGYICATCMHPSDPLLILQDENLFNKFLDVVSSKSEYANRFGLNNVLTPYLRNKSRTKILSDYVSMHRSPAQTALIRELTIFGSRNRFLKKEVLNTTEQDAIIDLVNETNDFGLTIFLIRHDGQTSVVKMVRTHTSPTSSAAAVMLMHTSKNVCERIVHLNDKHLLTTTSFFKGLVDKTWISAKRDNTKRNTAKRNMHVLTHSSGVRASDLVNETLMFAYESDLAPYPDLQYEVDTRAFPVNAAEVARTSMSMHREDLRRRVAMAIRADFYLLTELGRLRATATRPPQNFSNSFKETTRIITKILGNPICPYRVSGSIQTS
jgi:hypothetical protein